MDTSRGQIIVQLQGATVQTVDLTADSLTIGRVPDNGLVLPIPPVSRHHAELRLTAQGPVIIDLGSTNGTYVGGVRLVAHQEFPLIPGIPVQIGPFVLTYSPAAAPAVEPEAQPVSLAPVPEVEVAVEERPPAPARPTYPVPLPSVAPSRYLQYLPVIFHDGDFLGRFLQIFEGIWEPLEWRLDHLPMYFDPRTAPASMVNWLGSWLGLELDERWPEERRRRLVAEGMDLLRWRGTRYGLSRWIETCTGISPSIEELPEQPFVFRVRLEVPPGRELDPELLTELIETHKPAHAGYVLELV
ncbi:phage tail protein [Calidithermus chliarophilus]|uniref:phage tail protein n=1 Tax=Calidithermus chliarophilus TaxID=52023 RepID=UPI0004218399|nr:phage tail protein [Calidithermus chliarophilus]